MARLPQEQTLLLHNRSKENQARKLGEVEKRFGILSGQCAAVKQAHDKLEQSGENMLILGAQLLSWDCKLHYSNKLLDYTTRPTAEATELEICIYFVPLWTVVFAYPGPGCGGVAPSVERPRHSYPHPLPPG